MVSRANSWGPVQQKASLATGEEVLGKLNYFINCESCPRTEVELLSPALAIKVNVLIDRGLTTDLKRAKKLK